MHREDTKDTILTSWENVAVVLSDSESLNWKTVGLNLKYFLEFEVDDLDWTWFVILSDTGEESSASVHQLDLGNICSSLVGES